MRLSYIALRKASLDRQRASELKSHSYNGSVFPYLESLILRHALKENNFLGRYSESLTMPSDREDRCQGALLISCSNFVENAADETFIILESGVTVSFRYMWNKGI